MFKRQTAGSVVCVSCGYLVGVNDDRCYHCGRRNPGLWGFAPALRSLGHDLGFVQFVTGACVVLYVLTLVFSAGDIRPGGGFDFLSPSPVSLVAFGAAGEVPVFELGRWWTVLSASWLHGGVLHLLFNMYWIRLLAPNVGELYGPGRMVIIYVVAGLVGFTASSVAGAYLSFLPLPFLQGARLTVGASAPIFGLLGAAVYYGRRSGSSAAHGQAMTLAVMMFVFGLIMPGIDNYAHGGGFLGGFLAGRFLDPLRPERVNHMLWAVIALGASVAAVVASFVHWVLLA
jgi:rhomboid protease GluP